MKPVHRTTSRSIALLLLLTLGAGSATGLAGQPRAEGWTLRDCVAYALEHGSAVRRAGLEARRADLDLEVERRKAMPQLTLSSRLNYHFARPVDLGPAALFGEEGPDRPIRFGKPIEGGIGLAGELRLFDRTRGAAKDAPAQLDQLRALRLTLSREEVALEVARAYLQTREVEEKRKLLLANADRVSRLLILTEKQVASGFAKPTALERLQVARQNLEVQQANLDLRLEQVLAVLKYHMNLPAAEALVLSDEPGEEDFPGPILPESPGELERTELQLLEVRGRLADLQVDRAEADLGPVVSLRGAVDLVAWGDNPAEWVNTTFWYGASFLGLHLDVPLLGGPLRRAQVERARLDRALGEEEQAFTRRSLALQRQAAGTELTVQRNELESLDRNRQLAERIYALTLREYEEGITPVMELVSAELAMREAQSHYLSARIALLLARVEWLHAEGRLLDQLNLEN